MQMKKRRFLYCLTAIFLGLLTTSTAIAAVDWPNALNYSIGLSTDEASRAQLSAVLSGPVGENLGAKIGGWWILASDDNRAFLADAYIDYRKDKLYLAGGRKFVPFGPAGVLVSPGIAGGELQLKLERVTLQAITGALAFTPVTGGTRFTFAGNRAPADENMTAVRLAIDLAGPGAKVPATLGINALRLLSETGWSADLSVDANNWLNLFGETADFDDVKAHAYGVRLSDQKLRQDPTHYTMLVFYHRRVPVGFVPATVGASLYFENQTGWAGGLYHQFNARHGLGVYADREDAIITLFGYLPL